MGNWIHKERLGCSWDVENSFTCSDCKKELSHNLDEYNVRKYKYCPYCGKIKYHTIFVKRTIKYEDTSCQCKDCRFYNVVEESSDPFISEYRKFINYPKVGLKICLRDLHITTEDSTCDDSKKKENING